MEMPFKTRDLMDEVFDEQIDKNNKQNEMLGEKVEVDCGDGGNVGLKEMSLEVCKETEKYDLEALWEKVKNLEKQFDALRKTNEKQVPREQTKVISRSQMASWIIEAIKHGNREFGVSKSFLKKYLCEVHSMPNNSYYVRKLNSMLAYGIDEEKLYYDKLHQLYKLI